MLRRLKEMNETLLDLILGCILHSILFEIIGLIFVSGRLHFSLGLLMGLVTSILCAINMAWGLEKILSMEQRSATRVSISYSTVRLLVMLVVAYAGMRVSQTCFWGVVVGLMGLKTSAHMHVYTNVYITKKIRRKGR